jgi:hypothetical protein
MFRQNKLERLCHQKHNNLYPRLYLSLGSPDSAWALLGLLRPLLTDGHTYRLAYTAKEEIPAELQPVAFELSHVLSAAMKRDPTSDVLGYVLSMSGFHKRAPITFPLLQRLALDVTHYWLTVLGRLMSPCGSGINAIHWMENLIENHGPEALREASIYLEDIDPLMVKCCMIQLFHYFESRNTTPKMLSIVGIDTPLADEPRTSPTTQRNLRIRRNRGSAKNPPMAGFPFNAQPNGNLHLSVPVQERRPV